MRTLLILLVLFLSGCATSPEDKVKKELGWNGVLNTYIAEARKCQPGDVQPDCIIDKAKAASAITVIEAYRTSRDQCIAGIQQCDPCEIVEAVGKIAAIVGNTEFNATCVETFDLEAVFEELETAPEV